MDHKYFGQTGEGDIHHLDIPEALVGLVSGGIRNQEHLEVAEAMRKSCQVIVALGTCATHGGIPSLINGFRDEDLFERYYRGSETTDPHANPSDPALPGLLDRTYALDEKIKVDLFWGPPHRTRSPRPSSLCWRAGPPTCPPRASATLAPPSGKAKGR
jgi:F420-non-reducing hydrogenase small subunit